MKKRVILFVLGSLLFSAPAFSQKEIQGFWLNKNREKEINTGKHEVVRDLIIDSPAITIGYAKVLNFKNFEHSDTTIKYKNQLPVMKTVNTKAYFAKYNLNLKALGLTKPTTNIYENKCDCDGIKELVLINENTMLIFFGKSYTILTKTKGPFEN